MARMSGAMAVVDTLAQEGIDTIFAVPGVQNDPLFDAFYQRRNNLRLVHTRHEQASAYMATGYAKSTGRPSAYAVVPGPGLLNTTAALSTAYAMNAPVFCLTGQIRSDLIGRGTGQLHEIPDQLAILKSLTKFAARPDHVSEIPALMSQAFAAMRSGRQRPVAVEVPHDFFSQETEIALAEAHRLLPETPVDDDLVARAARLLGAARAPLIVIGGGAMDAGRELVEIAEMLQAPITYNQAGKGAVSDSHPLVVPLPVGHDEWKRADAVLAVGTRLTNPQIVWGTDDDMAIVRVDIDPCEPSRIARPQVGLVGDARTVLRALAGVLPAHNRQRPDRCAEMAERKRAFLERAAGEVGPQMAWLAAIRRALPEDGILVDEATQVAYCARFAFPVEHPRSFVTMGYQGTLGYGFPTALGAQLANPDRQVVSLNGDGGFMFNVQELSTAVQNRIPLITIVFNDGYFGNVRRMQKEKFAGRYLGVELRNPDFMSLAASFGCAARLAHTPDELEQAVREGVGMAEPLLIEVPVGEMPSPWPILHRGRVRPPSA